MVVTKHWLLVGYTRRNHSSDETLTTGRMLPKGIMVATKHRLLVSCHESCQGWNTNYWSDVPSGIISVKKHWLLVGCYLRESCQWRNTDNYSDVALGNHVSDETVTISRMLPLGIMSMKKLVKCFSLSIFQFATNGKNHRHKRSRCFWLDSPILTRNTYQSTISIT